MTILPTPRGFFSLRWGWGGGETGMATLNGLEEQGVPREDVRPSFRSKTARHWLLDKAGVSSKDICHRGLRRRGCKMPPALRAFRLSFSAGCFHQETLFTHSDFMYSKSATANGTCDPVIDWIKTGLWSLCHLNLLNYIIARRLWISYTQEPWFVSAVSIFFFSFYCYRRAKIYRRLSEHLIMMNERTRGEERTTRRSRETENKETERRMKRDRERERRSAGDARRGLAHPAEKPSFW